MEIQDDMMAGFVDHDCIFLVLWYTGLLLLSRVRARRAETEFESRVYHYEYYHPNTQSPGDP